jgi:hypothetical protein
VSVRFELMIDLVVYVVLLKDQFDFGKRVLPRVTLLEVEFVFFQDFWGAFFDSASAKPFDSASAKPFFDSASAKPFLSLLLRSPF